MGRPLAQSFIQDRWREVVVGWGGVIGRLARSSGHGGGYKVVVDVGDCFRSRWEVEGRLAHLFGQGRG